MPENEDEDIGYKQPPKATQWKPGQSGNPKGRPKRIKDLEKLVDHELSLTIRITEGGETVTLTKREVFIKGLVNAALKGDRPAQKLGLGLMKSQHTIEDFAPDASDREALMALFDRAKLEDKKLEELPRKAAVIVRVPAD